MKKAIFIFSFVGFLTVGIAVQGAAVGETQVFNVDPNYDLNQREELSGTLIKSTSQLYFYVGKDWWDSLTYYQQKEINEALDNLAEEFKETIYPSLTSTFGSEWRPGIDRDEKITVLIHQMGEKAAGYVRLNDEYYKFQVVNSNEREMIYLNADFIKISRMKSFLAHEFQHLITFNQKERKYGISEEIWMNEARSEYAPTLAGYDEVYEGSNLQNRIRNFVEDPSDSITEWQNKKGDYGALNLFIQYLVDHYGIEILVDSLDSPLIGISSLNEALRGNGFSEDFAQIFSDWLIAILVNDCGLGEKYCYLSKNLKKIKVNPTTNFLPFVGESILQVTDVTKNWSGKWLKFIGGKGDLKLEFVGSPEVNFKVSYLIEDLEGNFEIDNLVFDQEQKGEVYIPKFGTEYASLVIIPSIQSKISGFDGLEPSYGFSWKASIVKENQELEAELIKKLLEQISQLREEIAKVQAQIQAILTERAGTISCQKFKNNLYFGMTDNFEVRCLQEFLKSQGSEIYPEALVSGNFLSLTKAAVIRFQEKYKEEILAPLGVENGTGLVGEMTRTKINQLLEQ